MTHKEFLERLALEYPKTAKEHNLESLVIPSLIAPVTLRLPRAWRQEAEALVALFHNKVRAAEDAADKLRALTPEIPDPGNASVLMSYDFHVDAPVNAGSALRLIEINTNASMSLLIDQLHSQRCRIQCVKEEFLNDFETELGRSLQGARVAIVDDEPEKQKLVIEFLLYKELFEMRGAKVAILDRKSLAMRGDKLWGDAFGPIDLVYNRATDFYFEEPESAALREAMMKRACVITPHPHEYRLLADKNRLMEWSRPGVLESYGLNSEECAKIRRTLIRTREVVELDPDALWAERKQLIFKPRNMFGGKAVFRGSSISRGAYQSILDKKEDFLVQDFVPAPTIKVGDQEFKYDLRFFAYRDEVRVACARLYQGQMTNATTPGGGVTAIDWADVSTPELM